MTAWEFLWCKKRETHLEFGKLYKKKWKQKSETFAAILSAWMLAGYIPTIWSYDSAAFWYSPSSQYNKARSNLRPTSFGSAVIAFLRQYLIWPVFFCSLHWQNNVSMWRAGHSYSASNRLQVPARIAMLVCLLAIGTYPGRIPWYREFYTSCQCSSWNKWCLSVLVHASAWWFCTYQSLGHVRKEQWTWNLVKPWGIAYTRHQSLGIKLGTY